MTGKNYDVGVIGGGIAGAIAAIHLAKSGRSVALFERANGAHDKVCGEYLSTECSEYLDEVGINLKRLGAQPVSDFNLFSPKRSIERRLPKCAHALSRLVLDEALLEKCEEAGVEIFRATQISSIEDGFSLSDGTGQWRVSKVICATGKAEFRSFGKRSGRDGNWVGNKMLLELPMETLAKSVNKISLFVWEDGYGGISIIENRVANFAFVVKPDLQKKLGREWSQISTALISRNPLLKDFLTEARPLLKTPLTVSPMPYGYVRESAPGKGIYCVGDQLAVIPSLTGDGMAIAMMSGRAAANSILSEVDADEFHRLIYKVIKPQVDVAFQLHRLFSQPWLLDMVLPVLKFRPSAIDYLFEKTRLKAKELS